MTTPTRLAEIAERQAEQQAFEAWAREASPFPDGIDGGLYARAGFKAGWSAQLTAAQARSREDAEIMREAADKQHRLLVGARQHMVGDPSAEISCGSCGATGPGRVDRVPGLDAFRHTPDCFITKLRARADELEGGT